MSSSKRSGPPKHQNKYAWKPNADRKINETEVGGRFRPLSEITGVCPRCKEQIEWKRRYGKYKPLLQPAKCQRCSKRNVRQAYHNLCSGCAKEHGVCAKCCCGGNRIVGRDISEVEAEQKMLEEAIKNSRERERRALLRAMNKGNSKSSNSNPTDTKDNKVGQLFPNASLEDYARLNRVNVVNVEHDDGEICDDKYEDSEGEVCEDENGNSDNEDCNDEDDDSDNENCEEEDDNDENVADHTNAKNE
ncbi:C9orf85-like protein [Spatholobus suberectus]|nr:C9orf85-like protein [Spatholobus suberectus]